jgi:hypothetical protein
MNRAFSALWDRGSSIPGLSPWAGMGDAIGVGAIAATPKASRLQPNSQNSVLTVWPRKIPGRRRKRNKTPPAQLMSVDTFIHKKGSSLDFASSKIDRRPHAW